jgi:serine/threonine-protein kinase
MPNRGNDLRVLRLEGSSAPAAAGASTASGTSPSTALRAGPRQTEPLAKTTFNAINGELSPDGRWLAYQSNESGPFQISVRPFPNVETGHWTISPSGGTQPLWARSGQELFYLDGTNAMTSVPVHTTPTFSFGNPTKLFDGQYYPGAGGRTYDVVSDGQRFLMIKANAGSNQTSVSASMVVVINWAEELKAQVPTK